MKCEAEDQGGWACCPNQAVWQTKRGPRYYYCEEHRVNRHVWYPERELEPIGEALSAQKGAEK